MFERISLTQGLISNAPKDNYQHIDGGLGNHNLIEDSKQCSLAIDPLGIEAPASYDAASFIIYSGFDPEKTPEQLTVLASLVDRPLEEIARWTAVRSIDLAINAHNSEELIRHRYYNAAVEVLILEFCLT